MRIFLNFFFLQTKSLCSDQNIRFFVLQNSFAFVAVSKALQLEYESVFMR